MVWVLQVPLPAEAVHFNNILLCCFRCQVSGDQTSAVEGGLTERDELLREWQCRNTKIVSEKLTFNFCKLDKLTVKAFPVFHNKKFFFEIQLFGFYFKQLKFVCFLRRFHNSTTPNNWHANRKKEHSLEVFVRNFSVAASVKPTQSFVPDKSRSLQRTPCQTSECVSTSLLIARHLSALKIRNKPNPITTAFLVSEDRVPRCEMWLHANIWGCKMCRHALAKAELALFKYHRCTGLASCVNRRFLLVCFPAIT